MKKYLRFSAGILSFAVICLILWMMVDVKREIIESATNLQKKIEIHNIRFYGFQQKRLVFALTATSAWSGNDIDEAYLSDVTDGRVYNLASKLILTDIKAKKVYSNSRYDSIFIENGLSAVFIPGAYAEETVSTDRVQVQAEQLRYDSFHKKTYIEGNIKLTQGKTDIFADRAEIDNEKNTAVFNGKVNLIGEDVNITANSLIAYFDEERNVASGDVTVIWYAQPEKATESRQAEFRSQETRINCHDMDYRKIKGEEFITFNTNVKVTQKNKVITGDNANYNGAEKNFYLMGNVFIELTSLEWLVKTETKKKLTSKEGQEALQQKTLATGEELVFNKSNNNFVLRGDVHVDQPRNEAFAQEVVYDDKKEQFTLKNYVRIKKKGKDWIDCQEARMFLTDEVFEARDRVTTEFTLNKKQKK